MDVRVKMGSLASAAMPAKQEILTGLRDGSLERLLETLAMRHPEIAGVIKEAKTERDLQIFVNSSEVPVPLRPAYWLRDGDTVSLFVKNP